MNNHKSPFPSCVLVTLLCLLLAGCAGPVELHDESGAKATGMRAIHFVAPHVTGPDEKTLTVSEGRMNEDWTEILATETGIEGGDHSLRLELRPEGAVGRLPYDAALAPGTFRFDVTESVFYQNRCMTGFLVNEAWFDLSAWNPDDGTFTGTFHLDVEPRCEGTNAHGNQVDRLVYSGSA